MKQIRKYIAQLNDFKKFVVEIEISMRYNFELGNKIKKKSIENSN